MREPTVYNNHPVVRFVRRHWRTRNVRVGAVVAAVLLLMLLSTRMLSRAPIPAERAQVATGAADAALGELTAVDKAPDHMIRAEKIAMEALREVRERMRDFRKEVGGGEVTGHGDEAGKHVELQGSGGGGDFRNEIDSLHRRLHQLSGEVAKRVHVDALRTELKERMDRKLRELEHRVGKGGAVGSAQEQQEYQQSSQHESSEGDRTHLDMAAVHAAMKDLIHAEVSKLKGQLQVSGAVSRVHGGAAVASELEAAAEGGAEEAQHMRFEEFMLSRAQLDEADRLRKRANALVSGGDQVRDDERARLLRDIHSALDSIVEQCDCGTDGTSSDEVQRMTYLREAVRVHSEVVCETGFNAGHGAASLLLGSPQRARYVGFDLFSRPYTAMCVEFVRLVFDRASVEVVQGSSGVQLKKYFAAHPQLRCDIAHVDGGRFQGVPLADLRLLHENSHQGTSVLMDDVGCEAGVNEHLCAEPGKAWLRMKMEAKVEEKECARTDGGVKFCVGEFANYLTQF